MGNAHIISLLSTSSNADFSGELGFFFGGGGMCMGFFGWLVGWFVMTQVMD